MSQVDWQAARADSRQGCRIPNGRIRSRAGCGNLANAKMSPGFSSHWSSGICGVAAISRHRRCVNITSTAPQSRLTMNFQRTTCRISLWCLSLVAMACIAVAKNDDGNVADSENGHLQLAAQIDRNVHAGTRLLHDARAQLEGADGETRAELAQMEKVALAAEARLRRSLKLAETASPENWAQARAVLAANYEAYAQAVNRVERLILLSPASRSRQTPPR